MLSRQLEVSSDLPSNEFISQQQGLEGARAQGRQALCQAPPCCRGTGLALGELLPDLQPQLRRTHDLIPETGPHLKVWIVQKCERYESVKGMKVPGDGGIDRELKTRSVDDISVTSTLFSRQLSHPHFLFLTYLRQLLFHSLPAKAFTAGNQSRQSILFGRPDKKPKGQTVS